jgi:hypothetical protein
LEAALRWYADESHWEWYHREEYWIWNGHKKKGDQPFEMAQAALKKQ